MKLAPGGGGCANNPARDLAALVVRYRGQIQPDRAQIRGQIPQNTWGELLNKADTKEDTADTAIFSIWPLVALICVSAVAYFAAGGVRGAEVPEALSDAGPVGRE
jgi:hypothetical protein